MVKLAAEENVMEQISLKLEIYLVKKEDASTDIIVHMMEFVNHVEISFLIVLNVLFSAMKPFLNTNALNGRVGILNLMKS